MRTQPQSNRGFFEEEDMTSPHDRAILNSIFNPLLPIGECVFEDEIPQHLKDESYDDGSALSQEVRRNELDGVKAAESGDVSTALKHFNEAIIIAPKRASCYNNRAQALRLCGKIDEAKVDLDKALELSGGKGKAACQAYTQRALLHRLHNEDDLAKEDFTQAAHLGSEFAKAQLVQMNPYAALCNKMLHEVFSKLQKGEIMGI